MQMDGRLYPDNTIIRLFDADDKSRRHPHLFTLEKCIGTGASCIAYQASGENGIPVRLKQFCPKGIRYGSSVYVAAEEHFLQAYRQQVSMMREESISPVTAGLYGLYRDESGYYWTSVSSMAGQTMDKLMPGNALSQNIEILLYVAESIKAYHEVGWLLLDLKPENILVIESPGMHGINYFDFDSFVRINDLKMAAEEERTLVLSSTEAYSAPELLEPEVDLREVGVTADFYSVGAMLFTAVFGRKPDLLDCIPNCGYDFSSREETEGEELSPETTETITTFFHHTLCLSAEDRFQTDEELLEALKQILLLTGGTLPSLSEKFSWKSVVVSVLTFVLLLTGFILFNRPVDRSPVLSLVILPDEKASVEIIAESSESVLTRLKCLGFKNVEIKPETGEIMANSRTSSLGTISDIPQTIDTLVASSGRFYALGVKGLLLTPQEIERDNIVSVESRFGNEPNLDSKQRKQAGLPASGDYPYLLVCLDEEAGEMASVLLEECGSLTFGLNREALNHRTQFALAVPAEKEYSWYLIDGRWQSSNVFELLTTLLQQKPLSISYNVETSINPTADWQNPDKLTAEDRGGNQVKQPELGEKTVTFFYEASMPMEVSDYSYEEAVRSLKTRLDLLEAPYAFGADFFKDRKVAVCMPASQVSYAVLYMLPSSRVSIRASAFYSGIDFGEISKYHAEVIQKDDGYYVLQLKTEDSACISKLYEATKAMLGIGDDTVYLTCVTNSCKAASAKIDKPIENGVLLFDTLPVFGNTAVDDKNVPVLRLLAEITNHSRLAGGIYHTIYYVFNEEYLFSPPEADFGIISTVTERELSGMVKD